MPERPKLHSHRVLERCHKIVCGGQPRQWTAPPRAFALRPDPDPIGSNRLKNVTTQILQTSNKAWSNPIALKRLDKRIENIGALFL
jgi:hypothetical protein